VIWYVPVNRYRARSTSKSTYRAENVYFLSFPELRNPPSPGHPVHVGTVVGGSWITRVWPDEFASTEALNRKSKSMLEPIFICIPVNILELEVRLLRRFCSGNSSSWLYFWQKKDVRDESRRVYPSVFWFSFLYSSFYAFTFQFESR